MFLSQQLHIFYFYNYKDSESAVKKYYPDLYKYLYQVFTKKQEFFVNKNCEKIYKQELYDQQKYYFEWCIEYYIEHCKNYNEIADLCRTSQEPVYLTRNGEGDLVVMDLETFSRREKMLDLREQLLSVE